MRKRLSLSLLLFLIAVKTCMALQTKIIADNGSALTLISTKGLTRIAVLNDRISDFRGPAGAYTYQNDNSQGAIFIHPTATQKTPFTIFIATEQGHNYVLHLTPYPITADTILLKPKGIINPQAANWEQASPYTETITQLIADMANQAAPEGYQVNAVAKAKIQYLGNLANIQLTQVYTGAHLEGLVYQVKNHSLQPLVLTESEFYQTGDRAIALKALTILPQGETLLYKVRSYGN